MTQLDRLSDSQLDELDFGVIRMDLQGIVTGYNRAETELSGLPLDKVLGKNFFTQVAPCTNNYLVAQRFSDEATLDDVIDYVFTLKMRPTKVHLRLIKKPPSEHLYMLVRRRA